MKRIILLALPIVYITAVSYKAMAPSGDWELATKEETGINFEKALEWFRKTAVYQVNIKYASYTDYLSVNAHEKSEGYYKKDKKCFHSLMLGINTIQNEQLRLTVDTLSRIMILNNTMEITQLPLDTKTISELMNKAKAIKKRTSDNGTQRYRLEFNPNQLYSAYEFEINEIGLLNKMSYFYSKEINQETDGHSVKGKPRVEISFSDYKTAVIFIQDKEFSEKIFVKDKGKKYVQGDRYQDYQLKDYRFDEKK